MIAPFKKTSYPWFTLLTVALLIVGLAFLAEAKEQRDPNNASCTAVEANFINENVDITTSGLTKPQSKIYVESSTFNRQKCCRGVSFLASNIGQDVSSNEVLEFIRTCQINLVVIDFAWITYHWDRSRFDIINNLIATLKKNRVEVAIMYRPRVLRPSEANVHYAVEPNGTTAEHHNELCFAYDDSVAWAVNWGTKILEELPVVDKIILYNLSKPCFCEKCQDGHNKKHVANFLKQCRSEWEEIRSDVQIGHVGIGREYEEQLDFLCPFLCVNRADNVPVDVSSLLAKVNNLKAELKNKPVIPLAKICWSSSTNNTTEDIVNTIAKCDQKKTGYILWYYSWIFHSPDGRYLPEPIISSLGGNFQKLSKYISRNDTLARRDSNFFDEGQLDHLISELSNPKLSNRPFAALNKIIQIGKPAVPRLIKEMKTSNNWQIPKALGAIGDRRAVLPLREKLEKCDWSPMREVIAEALDRIASKKYTLVQKDSHKPFKTKPDSIGKNQQKTKSKASVNDPKSWVYFESKESRDGHPPQLVLYIKTGKQRIPVSKDTPLISYLEAKAWGSLPRLSISMNDTNRSLLHFDIPSNINSKALQKAEVMLDLKQSKIPTVASFDLAVHVVMEEWNERTACWNTQPDFSKSPALTLKVGPKPGRVKLDVTDIVKEWLVGAMPNHGILLKVALPLRGVSQIVSRADVPDLAFPYKEKHFEKLPWPHQTPELSSEQIEKLNQEVWIINDFPLYQSDEQGTWRYFHGAFDIVLDNGTKIYAMKDGWVKAINRSSIFISDAEGKEPSYGWGYTHMSNFQVKIGDFVRKGTCIGEVNFHGLPHIHLAKVFSEGNYWGSWYYTCMPNAHFTYIDKEPPIIKMPFYFFKNNSDTMIQPDASGEIILSGDIDIVVGIRDAGLYARSKENGFGDRLAVAKIDYEVSPVSEGKDTKHRFKSFDFRKINIKKSAMDRKYNTELTKVVYKRWTLFEANRSNWNKVFSYYVITNCSGLAPRKELMFDDRNFCWKTDSLDKEGNPVFPNGKYDIAVTAYDYAGNISTAVTKVTVRNDKPK